MLGFVRRVKQALSPPLCEKSTTAPPLRFGILGAAAIAPAALISPAKSHSEVIVYAVAARSLERAEQYAKKHGIEKVYGGEGSYQKLLDDPNVDAVYNPLPNGLHYEWTMKALQAGKHVLLEKPSADTAAETRAMFDFAQKKGLVLLEAFHYRFHPAVQRFKEIVASGEVGAIKHVEVALKIPRGLIGLDDIRYKLELGGGAMMDMGCYTVDCMRYIAGAEPTSVIAATADISADEKVDAGTTATLAFPGDVTGTLSCHLGMPPRFGFLPVFPQIHVRVECENGELSMFNFVMPTIYHSITVKVKSSGGKLAKKRVEKLYKPVKEGWKGEDWWTTYRYQLEAFVDAVRGRTPTTWLSADNAVADLEWVEKVYDKTGLGSRPASAFKLPEL